MRGLNLPMARIALDSTLTRAEVNGFSFPLGVSPTEPLKALPGYTVQFEAADGSESQGTGPDAGEAEGEGQENPESESPARRGAAEGLGGLAGGDEWEEWPDRFVFDIQITSTRVRALCRALLAMLPGRFYPILDILGHDAFREIDPYIAYELVGVEKFYDALRAFDDWLYEDGLVGFGAMSVDPFVYVFVDEHKMVTVRVQLDLKEKVERLLAAFDLGPVEELKGIDSVQHEHRSVLSAPEDKPEMLTGDEILERLRDTWGLQLNIDATTNVDEDGNDLGATAWQCVARCSLDETPDDAYAEVLLTAENLQNAEKCAADALNGQLPGGQGWSQVDVIRADRVTSEQLAEWLANGKSPARGAGASGPVHDVRWLSGYPPAAPGGAPSAAAEGGAEPLAK